MTPENTYHFSKLKSAVTNVFLEHNSASTSIHEWKGETITDFQEDLFRKVKAKVSEKWFYTYFKNEPDKLPRIDMLNLLSNYVGYKNWNDFKSAQANPPKNVSRRKLKIGVYVVATIISLFVLIVFGMNSKNEFHFCFVDEIKNQPITNIALDIKMYQDNESPLYFKTDSSGCFNYITEANRIKFVVQSPYHKTDTIIRSINSNINQTVKLTTDDYAMMLSYYTSGNVKDWNKHKEKLQKMIADDAQIYQLYSNNMNVEIYSKDDFVRLLTIPTKSLNHIQILEKTMMQGKIVKLKFMVL